MKQFEFIKAPQRSKKWLALRAQGLGASDMAVVMGVSPYKTPLQLWGEKRGVLEDQPVGAAANRGVLLEDAVAKWYEQEKGVKLRKSNGIVRLKSEPRFFASLDRTIVGEPDGIVEIKTSASPRWGIWPVPPEVVIQATWQMGIVGAKWCDVAALLGGLVFRVERVHFDEALWDTLTRAGTEFLWAVDTGDQPRVQPGDDAVLAKLRPQQSEELIPATDAVERIFEQYAEADMEVHFLEQKRDALETTLKESIGSKAGIMGDGWTIYWKQSRPSRVVDWKGLESSGKVPAKIIQEFTGEKPGSRRFIVKREGGKND